MFRILCFMAAVPSSLFKVPSGISTDCPRGARLPKTRRNYWLSKPRKKAGLGGMGWRVLVVWECEIRDLSLFGAVPTRASGTLDQIE